MDGNRRPGLSVSRLKWLILNCHTKVRDRIDDVVPVLESIKRLCEPFRNCMICWMGRSV